MGYDVYIDLFVYYLVDYWFVFVGVGVGVVFLYVDFDVV